MTKVILVYRRDLAPDREIIPTYAESFRRTFEELGHKVLCVGEGHKIKSIFDVPESTLKSHDFMLEIECGRNQKGNLEFQLNNRDERRKINPHITTAIRLIDSHGSPSLHRRISKNYNFVFYAVWDKRELFVNHKFAHFLPSASDIKYFNHTDFPQEYNNPQYDFGFFGSKHGLDRADPMKYICDRHNYTFDVREIGRQSKVRWPRTAQAMVNCKVLLNKSQKHDINQRIFESMLVCRPLITDRDPRCGLELLFKENEHYLGYSSEAELAEQMRWCLTNYDQAQDMAKRALAACMHSHLIKNRVEKIVRTISGKDS